MQVAGCRVTSSKASARTLNRRTETISKVRSVISGGDNMTQLASEIKSLTKAEREELLLDAQLPVVIPTDQALAMKADLEIPWNKLRILRRYIKKFSHIKQMINYNSNTLDGSRP